jgi:phosphomannomutase
MISVAGVRGIVGESLTPPVVSRFAAAFARTLGPGPVVVGRDARHSGPVVYHSVAAGLRSAGRDVVDLGLATTPTTEIAVGELHAAGGVIITASHNPAAWNALKFLSADGEFIGRIEGDRLQAAVEGEANLWTDSEHLGEERAEPGALDWHLSRVLGLELLDVEAIRRRALKVVVDGCSSVGGLALPPLLRALGGAVIELDCVPDGNFQRELEPLPEHLGRLSAAVANAAVDFGVAVDPDGDRAAFVDSRGVPLGEEFTLALGAQVVLERQRGPVVTNLSTSRIVDVVCTRAGVPLHRTAVGEAHVVSGMRVVGAVAGGEGNGGMILPAAHYGRDGLVAVALIAQALAASGRSLRELADALPELCMVKWKLALPDGGWDEPAARLRRQFVGHAIDGADGLRFARDEEWVHVRPSGTEPVVRIIAEAPARARALQLAEEARAAVLGRPGRP